MLVEQNMVDIMLHAGSGVHDPWLRTHLLPAIGHQIFTHLACASLSCSEMCAHNSSPQAPTHPHPQSTVLMLPPTTYWLRWAPVDKVLSGEQELPVCD